MNYWANIMGSYGTALFLAMERLLLLGVGKCFLMESKNIYLPLRESLCLTEKVVLPTTRYRTFKKKLSFLEIL